MTGRGHAIPVPTEELAVGKSSWFGARGSAGRQNWLRRLVMPAGHDDPEDEEIKRAAAADVAEIEEDDRYFDPDGPGRREDDL